MLEDHEGCKKNEATNKNTGMTTDRCREFQRQQIDFTNILGFSHDTFTCTVLSDMSTSSLSVLQLLTMLTQASVDPVVEGNFRCKLTSSSLSGNIRQWPVTSYINELFTVSWPTCEDKCTLTARATTVAGLTPSRSEC